MASKDGGSASEVLKFPRTQHLFDAGGGGVSRDDLVMDAQTAALFYTPEQQGRVPVNTIVEVEEKVDGANLGISIGEDGKLRAQNRSHYVDSSTHKQFSALDQWLESHRGELYDLLSTNNDVLYGEWLAAKHSIHYTQLPDLFLAFDIYDRRAQRFCSRRERDRRLAETSISSVRLVHSGVIRNKEQVSFCTLRQIPSVAMIMYLCPLHISRSGAPTVPRCCRVGQCEWVPNPASAVWASLGDHREVVGRSGAECVQCNRLSQGLVINMTPSPYQPTRMYALRTIRPMWMGSRRDVEWFCPDLPPTTSEANRGVGSANVKRALDG